MLKESSPPRKKKLKTLKMASNDSRQLKNKYLQQTCQKAFDHQAGCHVQDSRAPSRRYQSGHQLDQRG